MVYAFLYGVILTFGLIIPLGVQNIFIFNQGASQRRFVYALPSVLTASLCDSILIICAVLGVSVLVLTIVWLKEVFFVIGFCFLLYMGWVTWHSKPVKSHEGGKPFSVKRQIVFTVSVSLLNPHALLDTIGVIGTNSLDFLGSKRLAYTAGCILMSFGWFFALSIAGHYLQKLDKTGVGLLFVNKLSALIIWTVAFYIGWQILKMV